MAGTIQYLHIHGKSDGNHSIPTSVPYPNVPGYENSPDLYAYMSYGNTSRSGTTVSVPLSGYLWASSTDGSSTQYRYELIVYARLSSTNSATSSTSDLTAVIDKVDGATTWADGACTFNNVSLSTTTSSSTVYLQFYVRGWCPNCATDYHGGEKGYLSMIYQVPLSVDPYGYTVTFKGINGEVTRTLTGQTTLNSAYNNAAGGNLTTPQSYGGLTYTYKGWDTGGIAWDSTLNSNITLKSVWSVGSYSLTSTSTGDSYVANFYGYDGTFTVRTDEVVSATCNYTVNDYVGGNTKPTKQTSFNVPTTHITQVVGYPIRTTNTSSVWKPKTIAFANGSTTSISGSGTVDGGRQSYTITGTVTANVTITGNEATKHYLDFYDSNKRYHGMTGYKDTAGNNHTNTWVTDDIAITGNGTVKSYWHAPQVWKYRNGNGKNTSAEGSSGSGWNWWKDVELRKYDNSTQTWKITNKWKTVGTSWVNCDTDASINR